MKGIKFNAGDLLASLRGHRKALEGGKKLTMRETRLKLPRRITGFGR